MSIDASARYMFSGGVTAYFSEINHGLNDVDLNVGGTSGGNIKANIVILLHGDVSLLFTPWYEISSINLSNIGTMTFNGYPIARVQEPNSATNKFGLNLSLRIISL